jgi:AraC-like DNA-binding protein
MDALAARDTIEVPGSPASSAIHAWKPTVPGVREVLQARFAEHAYPPHTHDVWTLFVVDEGAVRYDLDRWDRAADRSMVSFLPPHVVHDGRPATSAGYRKRAIYLEASVLGEALIGRAVDRPFLSDPSLRARVSELYDALGCADDALEAEGRLHEVADRIRSALGEADRDLDRDDGRTRDIAESLRAYLDARLFDAPTLAEAAADLGASPTRLARAFSDAFSIPPHAYVDGRRLEIARDRILEGRPLADVAAEVGYVDQAHLTRRFKRFLGTTPGSFSGARGRSGRHGGHARRARWDAAPQD